MTTKGEGMDENRSGAAEPRHIEGVWTPTAEWIRSRPGYRPNLKQMTMTHTDEDIAAAADQGRREDESQ